MIRQDRPIDDVGPARCWLGLIRPSTALRITRGCDASTYMLGWTPCTCLDRGMSAKNSEIAQTSAARGKNRQESHAKPTIYG